MQLKRVHDFLVVNALPLWAARGVYSNGCFVEHLDMAGEPVDPGFTRVRAQARQIYVYSHAENAGIWHDEALAVHAEHFFISTCWLGSDRGWARRITRLGEVLDATPDLYDISFALFALAWRQRVAPDRKRVDLAHKTLDFLDRELAAPYGGYWNAQDVRGPRQQNPHMHLTEAMNAWFSATGEARFAELAISLVDLMEARFCHPKTGVLGEYFEEDWKIYSGPQGDIVEPGHQFEWAWIICQMARLTGLDKRDLAFSLIKSAEAGFDPKTGLTVDQVDRVGHHLSSSRRLWPQTEALKAAVASAEYLQFNTADRMGLIINAIFDNYLDVAPVPGTWVDHINADGSAKSSIIPATSFYHLHLAFLEVLRLQEQKTII